MISNFVLSRAYGNFYFVDVDENWHVTKIFQRWKHCKKDTL